MKFSLKEIPVLVITMVELAAPDPSPITSLPSHPPFNHPLLLYSPILPITQHSCSTTTSQSLSPSLPCTALATKIPYSPFSLFSNHHDVLICEVVVEVCKQCS